MQKDLSRLHTAKPDSPHDPVGIRKYYQNIIDNMPNNVYWLNRDCVTMGCNRNTLKLIGLDKLEDFVGITYEEMGKLARWTEGQAQSFKKDDMEVMESGIAKYNMEEPPLYDKNGRPVYYMSSRVPLFDENGSVIGVIGISVDITARKKMEQELLDAKQKAESANHAKTIFLASMSHDMKTPLSGIVTTAEVIIGDRTIPERGRQCGQIISDSGKQLADFFTSCLDLSKMEMEAWTSQVSIFSIKKLLEDIKALYLPKAMSCHLVLDIKYDDSLPPSVEGPHDSLYRVLLNLVGNAIKFTEQGSVTLRATLLKHTDDHQIMVEFQIQDSGMGIPEDQYQAIFEKLYRVKPSYESQIEGSGMGLYIVDQYVKRMDGEIRVESNVGEGSTFTVTVPLKIAINKAMTSVETSPLAQTKKVEKTSIQSVCSDEPLENLPRVLLVEDNEMIQFVTKSLLNTAGFSVDIASTGEEALDMVEPNKYGLIYMDIGLPVMNGYETTKAIRDKEKSTHARRIPIIALTGHGAVDVQTYCSDAGMQGVLSKPLSCEQATALWKHFTEDARIPVSGLTLLTEETREPPTQPALDIEASIKMIGTKAITLNLLKTLTNDLQNQFLPQIKTLITENKIEELSFLLHRQLGALAYAKAPRLEKKLLDLQAQVQRGVQIDPSICQEIEEEVRRVIDDYAKIALS